MKVAAPSKVQKKVLASARVPQLICNAIHSFLQTSADFSTKEVHCHNTLACSVAATYEWSTLANVFITRTTMPCLIAT